ncbi:MAG: hypothetical protein H3C51_10520 [Rubellimicrobium sp.]|nr:hypothetical protein [Rubellimicrobium sp.]
MNRPLRPPARPAARSLQAISRRHLISAAVATGVLTASGVPVAARARGGVLRLGLSGTADGWDMRRARGSFLRVAGQGAVYETLTEITAGGELVGELAVAWEPGDGARTWDVTLRPEVAFHDGRALRAADVLASLAVHRSDSPAAPILARIAGMRATGPLQLRFTLTGPDANFPLALADPHLVIAPEGRFDGIGSGLYRLAEFTPGERMRLLRVADHWRDGRAGWFDAVVLRAMPEAAIRRAALVAGHVDAVDQPGPLAGITARRGLKVVAASGYGNALGAAEEEAALAAGLAPLPGPPPAGPVMAVDASWSVTGGAGRAACYGTGAETLFPGARPFEGAATAHLPFVTACTTRLAHDGLGVIGPLDSGRIAERWWFA